MENTVSNGQGPKPHSAIEKGEQKINPGWPKESIFNWRMPTSENYLAHYKAMFSSWCIEGQKVDKLSDFAEILF